MLGRECVELLSAASVPLIATDQEVDIGDAAAVADFSARHDFDWIVNCAAYTRVDDAEREVDAAHRANALGPENLARAAIERGAALVHFSTDYVFDGRESTPYVEDSPRSPVSIYGKSKLEGEERVSDSGARAYVLRTSWLFGRYGRNFVQTILGVMAERETVRVVDDQWGRPTYCPDLARAAFTLTGITTGAPASEPGVYHFANADPTTWHGLATSVHAVALRLGLPIRARTIEPVTTAEFPRPAPRPAYSVLSTERIEAWLGAPPRPHREAVLEYLQVLSHDRTPN
jgi:dTDP-4-dehydrorhamnose reductase